MASVGALACRKISLGDCTHPAKPMPGSPAKARRFPHVKLLEGDCQPESGATKARLLAKKGNVLYVSFSAEKPGQSAPQLSRTKAQQNHGQLQIPQNHKQENLPGAPCIFHATTKPAEHHGNTLIFSPPRGGTKSGTVSSSSQKGLQNLKRGKFDQSWMIKWMDWYKFVIAMTRKIWDPKPASQQSSLSSAVRAESAKTAWSG